MKQLGNLAVVCAKKKDVLLQIHNGVVIYNEEFIIDCVGPGNAGADVV